MNLIIGPSILVGIVFSSIVGERVGLKHKIGNFVVYRLLGHVQV